MGLFSFLSRGNGNRTKKSKVPLKPGVSYTSFCPSPVPPDEPSKAGDTPGFIDAPSTGHWELTQPQLSLGAQSEDEAPASAPGVRRYREETVERPSIATGGSPPNTLFLKDGPRLKEHGEKRPRPLSFRTARPQTAVPGPRPGTSGSLSTSTGLFQRDLDRLRANSLRSDAGKAFRDILDAQSEIKPADFRARVQASGAREYGEDVAERNMGENGFDLESPHVLAFYAQDRAFLSGDEPGPLPRIRPGSKLSSYEMSMRRRSLRLSNQPTLPRPLSTYGPGRSPSEASHSGGFRRRRSVCTYMPLYIGSNGRLSPLGQGPVGLETLSPRIPTPVTEDLELGFSALGIRSPVIPSLPATAPAPVIRTARVPRDSMVLAKKKVDIPVSEDEINDSLARISALRSATRLHRSSTITSAVSRSRKHHSLYTLPSSVSSSGASRDTFIHATALSYPRKASVENQAQEIPESLADDFDHALLENLEPDSTDLKVHQEDSAPPYPQPRSFPLVTIRKENHDLSTTVLDNEPLDYPPPIRTRSMRGWSASSGTPTTAESTATSSSRPFHRPPSLHTADTSVDIDLELLDRKPSTPTAAASAYGAGSIAHDDCDSSCSSTESDDHVQSTATDLDADLTTVHDKQHNEDNELRPPTTIFTPFNMDDYLSSDAETLSSLALATTISSRRPTAEGEEELLFREGGYGAAGLCPLPGLADVDLCPGVDRVPAAVCGASGGVAGHEVAGRKGGKGKRSSKGKGLRKGGSSPVLAAASLGGGVIPGVYEHDVDVGLDMDYGLFGRAGVPEGKRVARTVEERRRSVLDTAADDADTDGESGSDREQTSRQIKWQGRRRRALQLGGNGNVDDEGYDADFVEDEEEEKFGRHRERSRMRAGRLSALCLRADSQEEMVGRQDEQQELVDGKPGPKVDVASAVRLRKQVRRARRLAGETSYVSLCQARRRMSLPVVRFDAAV